MLGTCARLYKALGERMTPLDVDRLELWQAAVMLGRDEKATVESMAEQLRINEARAAAHRARPKNPDQVRSRPDRMIRSA